MYDIAIIGAGPAGSTAARLLAEKYRVLLVDRRRLDAPFSGGAQKVCAGLLAPAAQKELARQGLGVPHSVTVGPQLFAVRTLDRGAGLERLYQRHYLNVDREAFDRWLAAVVPSEADLRFGWTLTGIERQPDGSLVRFRTSSGAAVSATARLVVGADGASSLVRRSVSAGVRIPTRYVAVQGTFSAGDGAAWYGAVFDPAVTDFYGWTVPKGDSTLVGVAMPSKSGAVAGYERFVQGLREDGFRLGNECARASAPLLRPCRPDEMMLARNGAVLLGEAAGLISPSSAEGISYALRSGAALAEAADSGLAGVCERYRDAAMPLALEVGAKLIKAGAISGTVTRRLVMRSGIGAIAQDGIGGFSGALGELLAP